MKIFIPSPNENWIVDRYIYEFKKYTTLSVVDNIKDADIIWFIAPWIWRKVDTKILESNEYKIVSTIHHIDESKKLEINNFVELDNYVDVYHASNRKVDEYIYEYTKKNIHFIPFWIDQNKWYKKDNLIEIKEKLHINESDFVIGSFQRDTESKGFLKPKLSKGPDRLVEIYKYYNSMKNVLVILTGPKRNWIKRQLDKEGIRYLHFSTADEDMLNEFYNILDIYIVASRVEGGPQAIYEAASVGINLISTDVGIANYLLDSESIFDMDNFKIAKPNKHFTNKIIKKHYLPYGIHYFDDFFRSL